MASGRSSRPCWPGTTRASATRTRAAELLDRVVASADADLLLPEQAPPLLAPAASSTSGSSAGARRAHPLLWSHGMFLAAAVTTAG